jgi:FkbM family methyltransferase
VDLYHNPTPLFTQWVTEHGLLHEPFVVVDIGVQGGPHPRWNYLGRDAHIYGFDPIGEVIDELEKTKKPNQFYRATALGDEDGERQLTISSNTYESSFYNSKAVTGSSRNGIALGNRLVKVRRLDTLFAAGEIPPADYIKIDCEGFEPPVIRGAREYLARSNVLCVTTETNLGVSPVYSRTPFVEICEMLSEHRLLVFDVNAVRSPRSSYLAARQRRPWPEPDIMRDSPLLDVGQLRTCDFIFCRDFVAESNSPQNFATFPGVSFAPTVDKLIKSMINFELHGLMDCAVDLAQHYATMLAERIDVEEAIERLIYRPTEIRNTADVVACMRMIGDLRVRIAELTGTTHALRDRIPARLGRKLTAASALLWRKNSAALRSLGVRGPETAAASSGDRSRRASVLPTEADPPKSFVRKHVALDSDDIEWHHEAISEVDVRPEQRDSTATLTRVGDARVLASDRAGSLTAYEESLGIARTIAAADPGNLVSQRDLSVILTRVGDARLSLDDSAGALATYEENLGIARTLAAPDPGDAVWQRALGVSLAKLANGRLAMGDYVGATASSKESLKIARTLAAADPGRAGWQRDLSVILVTVGNARLATGHRAGALAAYEESLKIARTLAAADPGRADWQRDLSVILVTVGDARLATGDREGALAAYEESLKIARTLAAADPGRAGWQRDVSVSLERLGDAKLALEQRAAALAAYNESLWVARRLAVADSDNIGWQRDLIVSLYKVATAADAPLARVTLREAVGMLDALAPDNTLRTQPVAQGLQRVVREALSKLT